MTRKPRSHSGSAKEPQVIDLDAEEVKDQAVPTDTDTASVTSDEVRHEAVADAVEPETVDGKTDPATPESSDQSSEAASEAASGETEPTEAGPQDAAPAEAIEPEPERIAEEPAPAPPPARPKSRGKWLGAAAILVIGLAAGGWLYRDVLSAYLPTNEMTDLKARLDVVEANNRTLAEQIAAASQSADKASQAATAVDAEVKTTAAGLADANGRIDGFDARVAAAEEAINSAKADLTELRAAVSEAGTGTGTGTVDSAALAAIGQRLDALEKDVASLKSAGGGGDTTRLTSALSQSLSDLKAKIASGAPFLAEYDRIARMVPAAPGLDVLATHAAEGLPTAQGLATELTAIIPTLPQPEQPPPPGDEGYWDSFVSMLSGIVTIRDIGETDWPQLAQRCVGLAEAGDLTQAIALIDGAEGTKPSALLQWHDRAAARLRLETAVNQVSEAVVRQITALGGAQ